MKPLQDKCVPTPLEDLEAMFLQDEGKSISEIFEEFDPKPIGVASLAQVHVGKLKDSGQEVAIKARSRTMSSCNAVIDTLTSCNTHTCKSFVTLT